jgi:hypothetical protein
MRNPPFPTFHAIACGIIAAGFLWAISGCCDQPTLDPAPQAPQRLSFTHIGNDPSQIDVIIVWDHDTDSEYMVVYRDSKVAVCPISRKITSGDPKPLAEAIEE